MRDKPDFSIIIPVYNEETGIGAVLKGLVELFGSDECEIIVVNDGSTDSSSSVIREFPVILYEHNRNKGYGASLKTGIRNARADVICLMDGDGQHSASDLKRLIEEFKNKSLDMVVGERDNNSHFPILRQPGKWLLGILANYLADRKIPDLNSGMRVSRKDILLKYIHIMPNGFSFSTTSTLAFMQEGYEVSYLPITANKRSGKSNVCLQTGLNTIMLIFRLITLFQPLKIFLPTSLFIGGFGFAYLMLDLFLWANISDTSVLLLLVGCLLFFFGLMADQMAHIRRELKS